MSALKRFEASVTNLNNKTKGLKFKTWFIFTTFASAILLLLWFLQISLIKPYYRNAKVTAIKDIAQRIETSVIFENRFPDLTSLARENGVCIEIVNHNGMSNKFNAIGDACFQEVVSKYPDKTYSYLELFEGINESESFDMDFIVDYNGDLAVYARRVYLPIGSFYLIINGYVTPEKAGFTLIQNQFFILVLVILLLATIASLYLSRKISQPITEMTESAKKLGEGNFDVKFEVSDQGFSYTELHKLSKTLDYATEEMSKTDDLRRDLIANITHDIKTPLTMILAYTEMIQDFSKDNPEKLDEHLAVIEEEAIYMKTLIDDMLELSKIESQTITLNLKQLDLNEGVQNIVAHYRSSYPEFIFNVSESESVLVEADQIKINQVLHNFMSNAIKFSCDKKQIDIRIEVIDEMQYVFIRDYGLGLKSEDQERVWDRYYQINKNHARNEGSGLGLAIAKGIIKAHHGDYGINSAVDVGVEFYFGIPLIKNKNEG